MVAATAVERVVSLDLRGADAMADLSVLLWAEQMA